MQFVRQKPQLISYEKYIDIVESKTITDLEIQEKGASISELILKDKKGKAYTISVKENDSFITVLTRQKGVRVSAFHTTQSFERWLQIFISLSLILWVLRYVVEVIQKHQMNKKMMAINALQNVVGAMSAQSQQEGSNHFDSTGKKIEGSPITLADVAGCEEEKQEVLEVIDFLKNPKKYKDIGATIPKGILLVGPPGTGKTLLAKAVAGEASVSFIYASGSEFVEKYVGVGAKRVRSIFEQAKEEAPCIVFIDEIDAIGRQRSDGAGNAEQEQTLNQLLVEMDGMEENQGIIIMAATNRPEMLDKAFLRKGRFDRKVAINLPDTKGREEILKVHAQRKKLSSSIHLEDVAKKTHGFSGADLYAVLNEAALFAVRAHHEEITMEDIEEGIDRVLMGHSSRKTRSKAEQKKVAIHESGHVVLGLRLSEADSVDKVTIVPRGDAGGYAMLSPKDDRYLLSKKELEEKICGLLGGRCAEELMYGTQQVTTGASNDLERATKIARAMVTEYGMSRLGIMQYDTVQHSYSGLNQRQSNYSENTAQKIDEAIEYILRKCYEDTRKILEENRDLLENLADALYEKETLTAQEIQNIDVNSRK